MHRAFDTAELQAAERALMETLPNDALMERAAAGLAAVVVDVCGGAYGVRVVLIVGSGDNGGDALLAGARLARRGARVDAVLFAARDDRHVDAARTAGVRMHRAGGTAESLAPSLVRVLARADVVVDGIAGLGGRGGLRPDALAVLNHVGDDVTVVAVDAPSGINVQTGEVDAAAVHATVTVCMGALKPGLLIDPGAAHAGAVVVIDIGLDQTTMTPCVEALDDDDILDLLPLPTRDATKYSGGVVGIVAGSTRYPGAAVLAVAGATRGGSGYVRFVGQEAVVREVRGAFPEAVTTTKAAGASWSAALADAGRAQAWVVGPGLGVDVDAVDAVEAALGTSVPLLLDADALTVLADQPSLRELLQRRTAPTVLTPHAGELARLLTAIAGDDVLRESVEARRLEHVRHAARALNAVVLLKGSTTLVATPSANTPVRVNNSGGPWLASAGTGDVLSGLIGSLLAAGLDARDAASVGAFVHGEAGRAAAHGGSRSISASQLADALPAVMAAGS